MSEQQPTIIYTLTDEAPLLATQRLPAGDPRLHGAGGHPHRGDRRHLGGGARAGGLPGMPDARSSVCPTPWPNWASKTLEPDANIIKLPNISASVAQLMACIK
jgi:isocitrate dehydrogenase